MKNKSGHDKNPVISRAGIIHLLPLILVAGLVVAAIGGIFYFNQGGEKPLIIKTETEEELETTEVETSKLDSSDWKIYRNEEYGFQFEYDTGSYYLSDSNFYSSSEENLVYETAIKYCNEDSVSNCDNLLAPYFSVEIYDESLSQYSQRIDEVDQVIVLLNNCSSEPSTKTQFMSGSHKGMIYDIKLDISEDKKESCERVFSFLFEQKYLLIRKDNYTYNISSHFIEEDKNKKDFEKFISTFEFIE